MSNIANIINHIAIVVDASGSMGRLKEKTVDVLNEQVRSLQELSKQFDQETRASVYFFKEPWGNREIEVLHFDKDVLRIPEMKYSDFNPRGNTPLRDTVEQVLVDLSTTSTLYGKHSFLVYVITDGEDTCSTITDSRLKQLISDRQAVDWDVAILVPRNGRAVRAAKQHGFPEGNIREWDVSDAGLRTLSAETRKVTTSYMSDNLQPKERWTSRGGKLFSTLDRDNVNQAVNEGLLTMSNPRDYLTLSVALDAGRTVIDSFVQNKTYLPYERGRGFYQLVKRETIQPTKDIAIRDRSTGEVFRGDVARQMIGVGSKAVRMKPDDYEGYEVFVQSQATNRVLPPGTDLLYFL